MKWVFEGDINRPFDGWWVLINESGEEIRRVPAARP